MQREEFQRFGRYKYQMKKIVSFGHLPLFPRIKQSPYRFFKCPSTYSSVCSIAIFINPSRHARIPRYVTPEFNCTITGFPRTCFKKSDGDFLFATADTAIAGVSAVASSIPIVSKFLVHKSGSLLVNVHHLFDSSSAIALV